jgi:hypothetical protein
MISREVARSHDDAFVRVTARMRERFEARVIAAESWTEGLAAALSDVVDGLLEETEAAQMPLADLCGEGGIGLQRLYDEARPARLSTMTRVWRHHHPAAPVPELQLEVFAGAVAYVISQAVERGDVDELGARMAGLTVLAPMAGA